MHIYKFIYFLFFFSVFLFALSPPSRIYYIAEENKRYMYLRTAAMSKCLQWNGRKTIGLS